MENMGHYKLKNGEKKTTVLNQKERRIENWGRETSEIGRPNVTPERVALTDSTAPRSGAPEFSVISNQMTIKIHKKDK